ncbi:hypothetical protein BKA93DRAFT_833690 [Sparassis latifolia]
MTDTTEHSTTRDETLDSTRRTEVHQTGSTIVWPANSWFPMFRTSLPVIARPILQESISAILSLDGQTMSHCYTAKKQGTPRIDNADTRLWLIPASFSPFLTARSQYHDEMTFGLGCGHTRHDGELVARAESRFSVRETHGCHQFTRGTPVKSKDGHPGDGAVDVHHTRWNPALIGAYFVPARPQLHARPCLVQQASQYGEASYIFANMSRCAWPLQLTRLLGIGLLGIGIPVGNISSASMCQNLLAAGDAAEREAFSE